MEMPLLGKKALREAMDDVGHLRSEKGKKDLSNYARLFILIIVRWT